MAKKTVEQELQYWKDFTRAGWKDAIHRSLSPIRELSAAFEDRARELQDEKEIFEFASFITILDALLEHAQGNFDYMVNKGIDTEFVCLAYNLTDKAEVGHAE